MRLRQVLVTVGYLLMAPPLAPLAAGLRAGFITGALTPIRQLPGRLHARDCHGRHDIKSGLPRNDGLGG